LSEKYDKKSLNSNFKKVVITHTKNFRVIKIDDKIIYYRYKEMPIEGNDFD